MTRADRVPRVSMLLPCRDAATYLPAAIASIEAQTFSDFEVIAVDDGSADDTPSELDAWAARDARVHVVHGPPLGIVAALSRALTLARAELIARMDADDIAAPERLAAQVRLLDETPRLSGCGTHVRYFPRRHVRDGARRYERWLNSITTSEDVEREAFVECPVAHPALLIRRDALDSVGGYRDNGWPEDYDLILRLLHAGHRLANAPAVLHAWRERPDRLSRRHPRYSLDAFTDCKAHHLARGRLRGRAAVIMGAGPVGKRMARALAAEGIRIEAFVELDARKIGQRIHGAPVVAYEAMPFEAEAEVEGGLARPYSLAAVAGADARARIRDVLTRRGLEETIDFCAVA